MMEVIRDKQTEQTTALVAELQSMDITADDLRTIMNVNGKSDG
ncbi:hypothetical protein JCM19233_110 [Vibrio astriarenae]|nr:hypothetical protein JCM19233_110 [Vibrio sp. C7]